MLAVYINIIHTTPSLPSLLYQALKARQKRSIAVSQQIKKKTPYRVGTLISISVIQFDRNFIRKILQRDNRTDREIHQR